MTEERIFTGQEKDVIDFIKAHGSITTLQAFGIGVARLASRVLLVRLCHEVFESVDRL